MRANPRRRPRIASPRHLRDQGAEGGGTRRLVACSKA
jgi:hypothetical protein